MLWCDNVQEFLFEIIEAVGETR